MTKSASRQRILRILLPLVYYLLVVGGLGFWLHQDLEQAAMKLHQEVQEILGEQAEPVTFRSLERAHFGLLLLGGVGGLVVLGFSFAWQRASWKRGQRLTDLLREALSGGEEQDEETRISSLNSPFEYAGRLGKELKSSRKKSSIQRARLSRMAQLVDVGVILFNSDHLPELASASAMRLLGEDGELPSQGITQQLFDALGTEDQELLHEAKVAATLRTPRGEVQAQLQLFHLDESCDHGLLLLLRDRKVLKALDTDFRLAAQLRGLSRLYLGLTHDLKAPLNAMGLNLALLRGSLDGDDVSLEKRKEWLRIVDEELTRLQKELDRLLAQTAPPRDEVERYDLGECLNEIRALLAPQARQQGVRLTLTLPEGPVWCKGRRDRVKQAFLNVALNGLEVAPEGSELSLRLNLRDGLSTVAVKDAGPGVPEEHQKHIFEMHFTTKARGTGIGLYIARSILEAEGGTLVLAKTSAAGTIFESCLPVDDDASRV